MPHIGIAVGFGIGALLLAGGFVWVALSTRGEAVTLEQITPQAYRLRFIWFVGLLIMIGTAVGVTLPRLPYASVRHSRLSGEHPPLTIQVEAFQFGWVISQSSLPVNQPVRLEVTSRDVNHSFGLYAPNNRLVGQVQAMPGYTNTLVLTFEQPGMYLIRCLELCGMGHHSMLSSLCVGPACP